MLCKGIHGNNHMSLSVSTPDPRHWGGTLLCYWPHRSPNHYTHMSTSWVTSRRSCIYSKTVLTISITQCAPGKDVQTSFRACKDTCPFTISVTFIGDYLVVYDFLICPLCAVISQGNRERYVSHPLWNANVIHKLSEACRCRKVGIQTFFKKSEKRKKQVTAA